MGAYSPYFIQQEMKALSFSWDKLSSLFVAHNGTELRLNIELVLAKPPKQALSYAIYPYPYGKILIVWEHDGAIIELSLSPMGSESIYSPYLSHAVCTPPQEKHLQLIKSLFTERAPTEYSLNLRLYSPSPFYLKVWQSLSAIPLGSVVSYKQIASLIGYSSGYQAIGQAVGGNPISLLLPCHRVVQSDGNLGGYAHGSRLKEQLLALELNLSL